MATTQQRPRPQKPPAAGERILKGFDYLTLDPSPRLRKMRDEQAKRTTDPNKLVAQAWLRVGEAIDQAFRITRETSSRPRP